MSVERDYYSHLVGIMLTTRGVRFSVAEIEKKKDRNSVATIAILSIYLAAWSFITILFPNAFTDTDLRAFSLVSFVASISLLVISLFDYAAGRAVFAEKMLQNAFEITVILREMERLLTKDQPDFTRLSELAAEYEAMNIGAGVNHDSSHFRLWMYEGKKPKGRIENACLPIAKFLRRTVFFAISNIFQILILVGIFSSTACIAYNAVFN